MGTRIQIRRDTSTNWSLNNPVLALGEPGLETDTQIIKYGDGVTAWNNLTYANLKNLSEFTTANLAEYSSNLYFTNARVYANVDLMDFATNSQLALYATNAQLTVYATNAQLATYATNAQLSLYATNVQISTKANISDLNTSNVTEGTNLYYSNDRVSANVATLGYAANTFVINQISQIYFPAIVRLAVTNSGASAYNFNSHYSTNNPNVYAISGTTISFSLNVAGHPFLLQEDSGSGYTNVTSATQLSHFSTAGVLTTGSSAQGQVAGTLYWNVPFGTSNTYRYICGIHSNMVGNVIVKDISVI